MAKTIDRCLTAVEMIAWFAKERGYTDADIEAGLEFALRKDRLTNPPGSFDSAGRFYASEETDKVTSARAPSRNWPYAQMNAARTADHCAEVFDANPLATKRFAKAIDIVVEMEWKTSNHWKLGTLIQAVQGTLKKMPASQ